MTGITRTRIGRWCGCGAASVLLAVAAAGVGGCKEESAADKAKSGMNDGAKKVGDAANKAADEGGKAVDAAAKAAEGAKKP